jgi:ABC-type lipoprotein release transport system permease subunit
MFSDLLYRFRALFRRKAVDREPEEELQYHLDREAKKYRKIEASPDLAMRVVQRTREIGIRIALGCTLRRAILGAGSAAATPVGGGVLAGLALSFFALRALQSEIYGVSAYDRVTLLSVPLLLVAIAAVASILPALRIARIDPVETLRAE